MKKLRNKIFITISIILTIVITVFCASNIFTLYSNQKQRIISTFEQIKNISKNDEKNSGINNKYPDNSKMHDNNYYDKVFMDSKVYTVILDQSGDLKEIINHDINSSYDTDENIENIAKKILAGTNKKEYIGNLFFSNYSYSYHNNALTIIDNSNVKVTLIGGSLKVVLIFIFSEISILIISYYITKWIITPVNESFEKQKRFIADSSHELKTPLAVITASCEAYFSDNDDKWIKNIQEETDHMSKLVFDLLDLASLEDKKNYEMEQIDLSNIVESTILTFESLFYDKKINLEYKVENSIMLNGNASLIRQLMEILIDNAIKHTDENNKVKIKLFTKDSKINLTVSNQGEPIISGDEEKIFERFYRADKSRNREAKRYGLGLSIAKEIVLIHNGKITAESNKGYTSFKTIFNIQ